MVLPSIIQWVWGRCQIPSRRIEYGRVVVVDRNVRNLYKSRIDICSVWIEESNDEELKVNREIEHE